MLKELALLIALLAFVTDARPYLKEEVRMNLRVVHVNHYTSTALKSTQLGNEADTVGIMNDDAVGMDDDSEDTLLEGKDFYGFIRRRCVHAFVLLQDKVNNYLRARMLTG